MSNIHYLHGVIAVFVFNHFSGFKNEKILCGKVVIFGSAVLVLLICSSVHNEQRRSADCFSKPGAYITRSATFQITCGFFWIHKRFYSTFSTYAVVLPKTCKHTLMCNIGGVAL